MTLNEEALDQCEAENARLREALTNEGHVTRADAAAFEARAERAEAENARLNEALFNRTQDLDDAAADVARLRNENEHLVSRFRAALDERDELRETLAWVRQALKGVAGAKSGSEVRDRLAVLQAALKETTPPARYGPAAEAEAYEALKETS